MMYRAQLRTWTAILQRITLTCGRVGRERSKKTGIPTSQHDYDHK